jgi:hypothetical protein
MSTETPKTESLQSWLLRRFPYEPNQLYAVVTQLVADRSRWVIWVYSSPLDDLVYLVDVAQDEMDIFREAARELGIWVTDPPKTLSTGLEADGQVPAPPTTDPPGVTAIEIARSYAKATALVEQAALKSA